MREKVASALSKSKDACSRPQSQTYNEMCPTFYKITQLYDPDVKKRDVHNLSKIKY